MEIAMTVPQESLDMTDLMENKEITVTGKLDMIFFKDDGLTSQLAKAEMLDNLVGMGLIDEEALEGVGYKA